MVIWWDKEVWVAEGPKLEVCEDGDDPFSAVEPGYIDPKFLKRKNENFES